MPAYRARKEFTHPVFEAGAQLDHAAAALVMIHGRGATAQDIMTYFPHLNQPDFVCLAPQAPDNSWYPRPFTASLSENEPYLSASLALISDIVTSLGMAGIPPERTVLFGFSQGACLALEYAVRHARRYGAVVGLSGGLIGPEGLPRALGSSLEDTPVFLGCSDMDPYIPKLRVEQAASLLRQISGAVTMRFYPHLAHTISDDEMNFVQSLMETIVAG